MNLSAPPTEDLLGYAASALVLLALSMRSLIPLRIVAIASNLTFIAYAATARLQPILVLHVTLPPINLWRLRQCITARGDSLDLRTWFR